MASRTFGLRATCIVSRTFGLHPTCVISETFGLHDQPAKHMKREYPESPKLCPTPIRVQRQDPISGGSDPKLKEDVISLHQKVSVRSVTSVSPLPPESPVLAMESYCVLSDICIFYNTMSPL
jgi:hypothetical protein